MANSENTSSLKMKNSSWRYHSSQLFAHRSTFLVASAAITLLMSGIGGRAFASCELTPLTIDNPSSSLMDIAGATLEKLSYEFDPLQTVSISGRELVVSNVTERSTVDLARMIGTRVADAKKLLPNDSCSTIVDKLTWSASSAANGSMNLIVRGEGRKRDCIKFEVPCFEGYKWYSCTEVRSATLADFTFGTEYRITPFVDVTRTRIDFKVDKVRDWSDADVTLATVATVGVLTGGYGLALAPVLESAAESLARRAVRDNSEPVLNTIRSNLPDIEPYWDLDREYRRLRIDGATFQNGTQFHLARRLPSARDIGVVCALRSRARQLLAQSELTKNPRKSYTVQEGESLWEIADKVYGDGRYHLLLAQANELMEPDFLEPGSTLRVPTVAEYNAASVHLVQGRESLWAIANSSSRTANFERLLSTNRNIANPSIIYPLQVIKLPSDATATTGE